MEYRQVEGSSLFHARLPEEIISEFEQWKTICDEIKNHPLAHLKKHENAGSNSNAYQLSVPSDLVERSFWLAYALRLCGEITKSDHRRFHIRGWQGHFDGHDMWINYSYQGNSNPLHNHGGFFSGVVYLDNQGGKTVFPGIDVEFDGTRGDMILFPSKLKHRVDVQERDYERITFAFNIDRR